MRSTLTDLAVRLLPTAVTLCLPCMSQTELPVFVDSFEQGLANWTVGDRNKSLLVLTEEHAHSGKQSAYSGPPGTRRVCKRDFRLPFCGRVELWFFDDMAPTKHQIAGIVGSEEDALSFVCRGGTHYEYRIGRTYTQTPTARTLGWHRISWDCNGARSVVAIDGKQVASNPRLKRVASLFMGSYWDQSTGWYDDVRVEPRVPDVVEALIQAEYITRESGPEGCAVQVVDKKGASGKAINHWDDPEHTLEWHLGSSVGGASTLLLKYATASPKAIRTIEVGPTRSTLEVASTGGWDRWQYAAIPVGVPNGRLSLRMINRQGGLNLDWLALIPGTVEPKAYGSALDSCLRRLPWQETARALIIRAADGAGVDLSREPQEGQPLSLAKLPSQPEMDEWLASRDAEISRPVNRTLQSQLPTLQREFSVPPRKALGPESELSAEYYRRLLRYVHLTDPRFRDWPYYPGCRYHKREGNSEWDVRQNATVALGYAVLLRGPYDASIAGVAKTKIAADLEALLRTLAITHSINFLPTSSGAPWGDHWQSAFWAGIAGQAAWLVWEQLPSDIRILVARMVAHEADRFNTRPPDSGVRHDTKAEENAWNSEIVALAACMFPEHPRAALWRERAVVYMLNSFPREEDATSDRLIDGKPVRERVTAVTLHPDYTLENHNRFHPDYLSTGSLLLRNALLYHAGGVPLPESMFFNVPETYQVLKGLTATNGSSFYVNGQDWWPHRHDVPLLIAGAMSVLRQDPEAAFLERATLGFFARMHERFDDGSAWDRREYNYANAEEEMIARYAELYLMHRMFGDGPEPVTADRFLEAHSGVKVYDIGGFVSHRTPRKFVSFAWKNGVMGLVFPADDTWFTAPYERGMTGTIACRGLRDTRPVARDQLVTRFEEGFGAAAVIDRCEGAIEQRVAMVSLPGDPVVYLEKLVATRDVTVTAVETGAFGILNEDAPGINPNRREITHAGGRVWITGATGAPTKPVPLQGDWVNIDATMGIAISGEAMLYRDEHRYVRSRLREVLATHWVGDERRVAEGATISTTAVVFLPNASPEATARTRVELLVPGNGLLAAQLTGGWTVVANLGDAAATQQLAGRVVSLNPLGTAVFRQQD